MSGEKGWHEFQRSELTRQVEVAGILVALMVPGGALLEAYVFDFNFAEFLPVRVGVGLAGLIVFALARFGLADRYPQQIFMVLAFIVSGGLQILVNRTGGAGSAYYVGHLMVMVTIGVVMRSSSAMWVTIGCVIVTAVYVVGSLLVPDSNHESLVIGTYFMVNMTLLVAIGAHMRYGLRKREFFAMQAQDRLVKIGLSTAEIAHSLKNVVGALMVWPDLIANNDDPVDRRQQVAHLAEALKETKRLALSINQQATFGGARFQPVELEGICRSVLHIQAKSVEAVGRLVTEFEPNCWTNGDPGGLYDAVTNLVVNGIQALRAADVEDKMLYVGVSRSPLGMELTVRDNGVGMSRAQAQKAFNPFYSANKTDSTGMGLSMAKAEVERHGGSIRVTSKLGEGTEFVIVLPEDRRRLTGASAAAS